ncbi:MAG: MotA/TolQ/ExbB proton channel family protein, partial [Kiritimatiellae bacterium]|nr:MotA/TolQ/ExbB proton channel family protein [Kiritimatiellia bacterium]
FALADVCYLAVTLRRGAVAPRAVINDVMDDIRRGALDEARKACDYRPSPFSAIAMAAIDAARGFGGAADAASISAVVEGEGARQAGRLQSRAQWLLDISSIAPMVGLLGTVLGMFEAFRAVGGEFSVAAKPVVLAQGVSLALVTTVAGLLVAIPCMALYAFFRRGAARQTAMLEALASDLVMELVAAKGGKAAADGAAR